jgi:hypothetical protein
VVIPLIGAAVSIWIMVSATTLAKIIAALWLAVGAAVFTFTGRAGPASPD